MRFCVRCGAGLLPGAKFCHRCGKEVSRQPERPEPLPPSPVVEAYRKIIRPAAREHLEGVERRSRPVKPLE